MGEGSIIRRDSKGTDFGPWDVSAERLFLGRRGYEAYRTSEQAWQQRGFEVQLSLWL